MAAGLMPGRPASTNWPYPVYGPLVPTVDWDNFDPESLFRELRDGLGGPDGEKMIWAFEQALAVARIDPDLLNHHLAAARAYWHTRTGNRLAPCSPHSPDARSPTASGASITPSFSPPARTTREHGAALRPSGRCAPGWARDDSRVAGVV